MNIWTSCLAVFLWATVALLGEPQRVKAKRLTVDEAKFEMVQLYLASDVPQRSLRTKYPEIGKADKAARDAMRNFSSVVKEHPQLKARFEEIDLMNVSIPEKMKLWKPLYIEAKEIPVLKKEQQRVDVLRVQALRLEAKALKAEGFEGLAAKLEAILARTGKKEAVAQ